MDKEKIIRRHYQPLLEKYPTWATSDFRAWFSKEWRKAVRRFKRDSGSV